MILIWHWLILLIFLIYLIFIFVFFGKKRCAKLETQQRLMLRSFMCHRQVRLLLFSKPWKPKCHWLCASPRVFPSTTWFASNTPWFASRRAVWSDQIVQELSHQSRWVHQRHPSLVGNVLHCFVWFAVQNRHYASCRPQKRIDRCCIAFGYLDIRGCQPDHRNRLGTDIVRRHRWRSVQRHRFHRLSRSVPQRSRNQRYHSDWWDRWTSRREGCRIFAAAQSGKHIFPLIQPPKLNAIELMLFHSRVAGYPCQASGVVHRRFDRSTRPAYGSRWCYYLRWQRRCPGQDQRSRKGRRYCYQKPSTNGPWIVEGNAAIGIGLNSTEFKIHNKSIACYRVAFIALKNIENL